METQLQKARPVPACSKPAAGRGFKTTTPILLIPGTSACRQGSFPQTVSNSLTDQLNGHPPHNYIPAGKASQA